MLRLAPPYCYFHRWQIGTLTLIWRERRIDKSARLAILGRPQKRPPAKDLPCGIENYPVAPGEKVVNLVAWDGLLRLAQAH